MLGLHSPLSMHHPLSLHGAANVICLLTFLSAVAGVDLHRRRIPNALTLAAAATGLLVNLATTGVAGLFASTVGLIIGLVVFLPFYLMRGMGAGDVKAMSAIGAFLGAHQTLLAAVWILVVGAVAALVISIVRSRFPDFLGASSHEGAVSPPQLAHRTARRFPYGPAIACGTAASLLWG